MAINYGDALELPLECHHSFIIQVDLTPHFQNTRTLTLVFKFSHLCLRGTEAASRMGFYDRKVGRVKELMEPLFSVLFFVFFGGTSEVRG